MVGLYVNPPEHAVVLCVDEKSQIQALDRAAAADAARQARAADARLQAPWHHLAVCRARRQERGKQIGQTHRRHRRSEEHTSELQSPCNLVCRLLLEKKK